MYNFWNAGQTLINGTTNSDDSLHFGAFSVYTQNNIPTAVSLFVNANTMAPTFNSIDFNPKPYTSQYGINFSNTVDGTYAFLDVDSVQTNSKCIDNRNVIHISPWLAIPAI